VKRFPGVWPKGIAALIDSGSAAELAKLLKAVADPARLQLLALIRASEDGECCACDLTESLGLSQPTVNHHLRVLTDAGLITREKRATWAWFSIKKKRLNEIAAVFPR
jgi:ArsR family transcriptional regulator